MRLAFWILISHQKHCGQLWGTILKENITGTGYLWRDFYLLHHADYLRIG